MPESGRVIERRWRRRRRWWLATPAIAATAGAALLTSSVLSSACGTGGAAIGCATPTLAPDAGVSVVTGVGHLTGVVRTRQGVPVHEFEIDQVRVLAGPPRATRVRGSRATASSPRSGLAPAQVPGRWAPDGRVLAHLSPEPDVVAGTSTVRVRPIVDGDVVFSAADCGSAPPSLTTTAFDGPLAEVPGSRSEMVARCHGGFRAGTLSEVERLLG